VECHFLFAPEEIGAPSFDPSDAVEFWDITNRLPGHSSRRRERSRPCAVA
jgi:hypothetical protein